jgi:hypothetical protein
MNLFQLLQQSFLDVNSRAWMALAVLLVGYVTTLTSDTSKFPVNIPTRWQPVVVVVLGQVYAVLLSIQGGTPWEPSVWHGLLVSFTTMGLFDLVINGIFNGNPPSWLKWLAAIDPNLAAAKMRGVQLVGPVLGHKSVPPPAMPKS